MLQSSPQHPPAQLPLRLTHQASRLARHHAIRCLLPLDRHCDGERCTWLLDLTTAPRSCTVWELAGRKGILLDHAEGALGPSPLFPADSPLKLPSTLRFLYCFCACRARLPHHVGLFWTDNSSQKPYMQFAAEVALATAPSRTISSSLPCTF
ncbi:hypothetical protein MPH_09045 [Macrophomina phaseolina MS6]|uniref:Uncharacterized protein n=1 Tax=Macrophomina phaseolina (strain MS6) TaxID=1126212 RepID=K2RLV9_MACPH|nr:hypothetical protein MPH_09045 [Macrophomina phaseolina MS6]